MLSTEQFYTDAEIQWFGPHGGLPRWTDPHARQFACLIHEEAPHALYLLFNAGVEAVDFKLPPVLPGTRWHLALDTSHEAPHDLFAPGEEPILDHARSYQLNSRSSAILVARPPT